MKKPISFSRSASDFKRAKIRKEERKKQSEILAQEQAQWAQAKMKKIYDALLIKALANLREVMQSDKDFRDYLVRLFGTNFARFFDDRSGACGFPVPPLKWKKEKLSELIPGVKCKVESLIGTTEDYKVPISVLVLYGEYESKQGEVSTREVADGESNSQNRPVLALTALRSWGFGKPEIDQLGNFQLVIIDEQYESQLDMTTYSWYSSVSVDPGFESTLRKLTTPKTTFEYFLKRFGSLTIP
ncbi:MAG: hypothetical protein AAB629_02760 [Patescibacteria group bacterium]